MQRDKPELFLVLGPSGAGKSRLFTNTADIGSFNKDLVLQRLSGGATRSFSREVRWLADADERAFWDKHLAERISFTAERTFRHSSDLELLQKPWQAGFHIFGHGKKYLAQIFAVMNLLAFAFHTVCDCREPLWKNARERSGKRTEFFRSLHYTTAILLFQNWQDLFETLTRQKAPPT
jgi:hypothetical protein